MFILINWFTLKTPIVVYLDNSGYNSLGKWSSFLCLNPNEYGYTNSNIQFTGVLGGEGVASISQIEHHIDVLVGTKEVNKWASSIDKTELDKLIAYAQTSPTFASHSTDPNAKDWYTAMLYALNNDYSIDGVKWKIEIAKNLPIANNINDLAGNFVHKGIVYDVNGVVCYSPKWYSIGYESFFHALNISIKVTMIIASSIILTSTTTPSELTNGIEKLFSPLKIFKFPANECALILSIGIRFIPSLLIESRRILNAQAARGLDFYNGNFWVKIKSLISSNMYCSAMSLNINSSNINILIFNYCLFCRYKALLHFLRLSSIPLL